MKKFAFSVADVLNDKQLADAIGVSPATVRHWRLHKKGPVFRKLGSSVRYFGSDVIAWIESQPTGGSQTEAS